MRISIDDLASRDPDDEAPVVLTSPRSIKVCLDHGVEPEMLVPKTLADFAKPGLSREHQRLKYEHYESIRRERIEVLSRAETSSPWCPSRRRRGCRELKAPLARPAGRARRGRRAHQG